MAIIMAKHRMQDFSFPATTKSCLPSKHASFRVHFFYCSTAPVVQGLLIVEVSRSTIRLTTLDRIPLDEWSARRRGLCLTTHNTQKRQTFMASAGFEPTIPASELPKTYALDCAATGTGKTAYLTLNPPTWKIWWAPNNASSWQMGLNWAFKGLNFEIRKL